MVKVSTIRPGAALLSAVLLFTTLSALTEHKAFAASAAAPINVQSFVGGNSIALLWNHAAGDTPVQYKVYRDDVLVATQSPSTENSSGTVQRFYDTNVVNGVTYNYQVSAVDAAATESARSVALAVIQPLTPFPVPNITISSTVPASALPMLNRGKALLQIWYPKIVTKLGSVQPTPTAFTMKSIGGTGNPAFVSGTTMVINEGWIAANPTNAEVAALFIHESTHIAQAYVSPIWIVEGMASYVGDFVFGNNPKIGINFAGDSWMQGYGPVSYFFNWISVTYKKPNFIRDLHASVRSGFSPAFFQKQTGESIGELWLDMTSRKLSSPLALNNAAAAKCMDLPSGNIASGTLYQLYPCNGTSSQELMFVPASSSSNEGALQLRGLCVDVRGGGVADGVRVWSYTCNNGAAQKWTMQTNGSLQNPASRKCLQPVNGGTTQGVGVEIRTCNGSATQNWRVRPLSQMQNFSTASLCLESVNGNVAGSNSWNNTCKFTVDQQLHFVPTSPGSADGAYKMYGDTKCLDVYSSGVIDGTRVFLFSCNGTAAQKWVRQADNTLKNPNSGKCLQPVNGSTKIGALMEIRTCTAATVQKWKFSTL